jgi:hypothetical protein
LLDLAQALEPLATILLAGLLFAAEPPPAGGPVAPSASAPAVPSGLGPIDVSYAFQLSTTTGFVPSSGLQLAYDHANKESLLIGDGLVRVFNAAGMEIYSFGQDPEIGSIVGVAPIEDGGYLVLTYREGKTGVAHVSFRGEFIERIPLSGLPDDVANEFVPLAIGYAGGQIFLGDLAGMRIAVADRSGKVTRFVDVARMLEVADQRQDYGIRALRVTPDGDVLFTVQALFRAYVLRPDGTLRGFGVKGSAPGKFNVISGIDRDADGRYYVADILKSAVIVFDRNFKFVKEFGYRGRKPGSLASPVDVVAGNGQILISNLARKGVAVYRVRAVEF